MKYLYALVIGIGLTIGSAGIAAADGGTGYVDPDGTLGEFVTAAPSWFGSGYFGPFNGTHGVADDNGKQDMEPYDPDQGTYPVAEKAHP